jgi:DNA processing protein
MNDSEIIFGLNELEDIGWNSIAVIFSELPDIRRVQGMSVERLMEIGLSFERAGKIRNGLDESFVNKRLSAYQLAGIDIVTIYDEHYPPLLRKAYNPPWVLYCKGNIELLNTFKIAMVGTRTPTVYGKRIAEQLSRDLSGAGLCIVSGMARGIDSECHKGALQAAGGTIAVLGSGVDIVYPPENYSLYREIVTRGLVVSEFPLGTKPHPGLFPLRNRIISGLCKGTVVVEAAVKSGSLITAAQALKEYRDVFAVPGPINSPKSAGVFPLIKQGAKVVTCAEDIIEEYKHMLEVSVDSTKNASVLAEPDLNADEQFLIEFLTLQPTTFDELLEKSKYAFGHLHSVLLSLLMKKKIEQLPGSTYIINY